MLGNQQTARALIGNLEILRNIKRFCVKRAERSQKLRTRRPVVIEVHLPSSEVSISPRTKLQDCGELGHMPSSDVVIDAISEGWRYLETSPQRSEAEAGRAIVSAAHAAEQQGIGKAKEMSASSVLR